MGRKALDVWRVDGMTEKPRFKLTDSQGVTYSIDAKNSSTCRCAREEFVNIFERVEDPTVKHLLEDWFQAWFDEACTSITIDQPEFEYAKSSKNYLEHVHKRAETELIQDIVKHGAFKTEVRRYPNKIVLLKSIFFGRGNPR